MGDGDDDDDDDVQQMSSMYNGKRDTNNFFK